MNQRILHYNGFALVRPWWEYPERQCFLRWGYLMNHYVAVWQR